MHDFFGSYFTPNTDWLIAFSVEPRISGEGVEGY